RRPDRGQQLNTGRYPYEAASKRCAALEIAVLRRFGAIQHVPPAFQPVEKATSRRHQFCEGPRLVPVAQRYERQRRAKYASLRVSGPQLLKRRAGRAAGKDQLSGRSGEDMRTVRI